MKQYFEFAAAIVEGATLDAAAYFADMSLKPCVGLAGSYVYILADPRSRRPFYVGKGTGDRVFDHVREWKAGRVINGAKHRKIGQIIGAGAKVDHWCVLDGLDEDRALLIEHILIRRIGLTILTNLHRSGEPLEVKLGQIAEHMLRAALPFPLWQKHVLPTLSQKGHDHVADYHWIVGKLAEVAILGRLTAARGAA